MTYKFILKTQWAVLHLAAGEDDRVVSRSSADEAHIAQHFLVFAEPAGACRGDFGAVGVGSEVDGESLTPDRVGKMNVVRDGVAFARVHSDEFAVFADFHALEDAQILAAAALGADADRGESLDVG